MRTTEQSSNFRDLDKMNTETLLRSINKEDQTVADAVALVIPDIKKVVDKAFDLMDSGGRLFYIGAGTSGRLGILDASECPPTFGVPFDWVIGLIAGGDRAIRKAVEFAEDDTQQGWKDLQAYDISQNDMVVGIAASGSTPYVVGALAAARRNGVATAAITCNTGSAVAAQADYPIEVIVGPEFVTGSTRMKSGTAQKLILNMISTSVMIKLGRVKGNKMVDMQLSNNKLVDRGERMVMEALNIPQLEAAELLKKFGSVRKAIDHYNQHNA